MTAESTAVLGEHEGDFFFHIAEATVALFYLLHGMELATTQYPHRPEHQRFAEGAGLRELKTYTAVSAAGPAMMGPDGIAAQMAFKGWVADIYDKWERSRHKAKRQLDTPNAAIASECMGDFRLIRNDLIHNDGIASTDQSGRCTVLNWFKPGERMLFKIEHVFDLCNRLHLLLPQIEHEDKIVIWGLKPYLKHAAPLRDRETRITSLVLDVQADEEEGTSKQVARCVFSDGVFGNLELDLTIPDEQFKQGHLNSDSDLLFPDGHLLSADQMYFSCHLYILYYGDMMQGDELVTFEVNRNADDSENDNGTQSE